MQFPQPVDPGAGAGSGATPAIRASDAERDHAIALLRDAASEGRLTFEELAERVEAAGTARTRGELAELTRDLPGPGAGSPSGDVVAVPAQRSSVFGDVRQVGAWSVPEASRWETLFGDVVLDLREAHVNAAETSIDVGTVFGDVELLVPDGVAVDVRVRTVFGGVRQDAGAAVPRGAPRVVLTGSTFFGDVRVRSERLRDRLLRRRDAR